MNLLSVLPWLLNDPRFGSTSHPTAAVNPHLPTNPEYRPHAKIFFTQLLLIVWRIRILTGTPRKRASNRMTLINKRKTSLPWRHVIACAPLLTALTSSAATHSVRVNADGTFTPANLTIAENDTVVWHGPGSTAGKPM